MVTYVYGDIFKSPAQVLTNAVNCVGVTGKGVALEFKKHYKGLFEDYKALCDKNGVVPGKPYLWENDRIQVLNFPTKRHWKDSSHLEDIEAGLRYLSENYTKMEIDSIAMPALGCGNGGLQWSEVHPLIDKYLGSIIDLDVYVYQPQQPGIQIDPPDKEKKVQFELRDKPAAKPATI